MPRTFTLARLMLGVTLVCIVCGLAVNLPFYFGAFVALYCGGPVTAVTLILCSFSKRRRLLVTNAAVGAVFGFAFLPEIGPLLGAERDSFGSSNYSFLLPAIGAMVLAGMFLVVELYESRTRGRSRWRTH